MKKLIALTLIVITASACTITNNHRSLVINRDKDGNTIGSTLTESQEQIIYDFQYDMRELEKEYEGK